MKFLFIFLFLTTKLLAEEANYLGEQKLYDAPAQKFTQFLPTYGIVGENDIKIQFSGKYRLAQSQNVYLAFTQTMFWQIYDDSKPFKDINFTPEVFYRLLETEQKFIKSIDIGYSHTSNGKDDVESRSVDKVYLKLNSIGDYKRHTILTELKLFDTRKEDWTNRDIQEYLGYWDLQMMLTKLMVHNEQQLDLEFRIFAGSKVVDFSKGGRSVGLLYRLGSKHFNPTLYAQYYSGHAENLISYNLKTDEVRVGLLLSL